MALRSIQGLGQGSDQLRGAIHAMLPGPGSPNKEYALRQLAIFNALVQTLKGGVAKSGISQPKVAPVAKTGGAGSAGTKFEFPIPGSNPPKVITFTTQKDLDAYKKEAGIK
jgi:hypothetical protein